MDVTRVPSVRWFCDDGLGESWARAAMLKTILSGNAIRRVLMTLLVVIPDEQMRAGIKVFSCLGVWALGGRRAVIPL
jgi:hypothetical protein